MILIYGPADKQQMLKFLVVPGDEQIKVCYALAYEYQIPVSAYPIWQISSVLYKCSPTRLLSPNSYLHTYFWIINP